MNKFRDEFSMVIGCFSENDFLSLPQFLNVLYELRFIDKKYDNRSTSEMCERTRALFVLLSDNEKLDA